MVGLGDKGGWVRRGGGKGGGWGKLRNYPLSKEYDVCFTYKYQFYTLAMGFLRQGTLSFLLKSRSFG